MQFPLLDLNSSGVIYLNLKHGQSFSELYEGLELHKESYTKISYQKEQIEIVSDEDEIDSEKEVIESENEDSTSEESVGFEESIEEIEEPPKKKQKKAEKSKKLSLAEQITQINEIWQEEGTLLVEIREHIAKHIIQDKNPLSKKALMSNFPFINACKISDDLLQEVIPLVEDGKLKKQVFVDLSTLNDEEQIKTLLRQLQKKKLTNAKLCGVVKQLKWATRIWQAAELLASRKGFSGCEQELMELLGGDKIALEQQFGPEFKTMYRKANYVPNGTVRKAVSSKDYPATFIKFVEKKIEKNREKKIAKSRKKKTVPRHVLIRK